MQVSTRDPAVVKHILQDAFSNFVKTETCRQRFVLDLFDDFLGEGIFAIDHGEHARDGGKHVGLHIVAPAPIHYMKNPMYYTFENVHYFLCNKM